MRVPLAALNPVPNLDACVSLIGKFVPTSLGITMSMAPESILIGILSHAPSDSSTALIPASSCLPTYPTARSSHPHPFLCVLLTTLAHVFSSDVGLYPSHSPQT